MERTGVKEAEKRFERMVGATIFAVVGGRIDDGRIIITRRAIELMSVGLRNECDCLISPHGGQVRS